MENGTEINLLKSKLQTSFATNSNIPSSAWNSHLTDFDYLRFLQAHGMDPETSLGPLRRSVLFRQTSKAYKPGFEMNEAGKADTSSMYFGRTAVSNEGYLLIYDLYFPMPKTSQLDIVKHGKGYGITDLIQNKIHMQEQLKKDMHAIEAETGRQSGALLVIDLKGMDASPAGLVDLVKSSFKDWADLFESLYPEDLKQVRVINAPGLISVIWNAVSAIFPSHTMDKVKVLGKPEDLLQDFEKVNLPTFLGGTLHPTTLPEEMRKFKNLRGDGPIVGYTDTEKAELLADHQKFSVSKGQSLLAVVELKEKPSNETKIEYSFTTNAACDFGIFYSPKDESKIEPDTDEWIGPHYAPLIACDIHPERGETVAMEMPGFYYLRFASRPSNLLTMKKLEVELKVDLAVGDGSQKLVPAEYRVC